MDSRWLGISYRVPSEPSRKRVYVWRKVKEMGAVYLQQAVGVVPFTDALLAQLETLRDEVGGMGGEAAIAFLTFIHPEDEERLRADSRALRDEEYSELTEKCEGLVDELERETASGKFTFAEVEESEEELAKIQRWMKKISSRDYFDAPGRADAERAYAAAEERLSLFSDEVFRREGLGQA
ncbi:MAG: Chromate resistance protein ChrB [Clostridia bacterium]|nr:Chromate resistance protein ChrB [Clostridia bacterium]